MPSTPNNRRPGEARPAYDRTHAAGAGNTPPVNRCVPAGQPPRRPAPTAGTQSFGAVQRAGQPDAYTPSRPAQGQAARTGQYDTRAYGLGTGAQTNRAAASGKTSVYSTGAVAGADRQRYANGTGNTTVTPAYSTAQTGRQALPPRQDNTRTGTQPVRRLSEKSSLNGRGAASSYNAGRIDTRDERPRKRKKRRGGVVAVCLSLVVVLGLATVALLVWQSRTKGMLAASGSGNIGALAAGSESNSNNANSQLRSDQIYVEYVAVVDNEQGVRGGGSIRVGSLTGGDIRIIGEVGREVANAVAEPAEGYEFAYWSSNVGDLEESSSESGRFLVPGNAKDLVDSVIIYAVFKKVEPPPQGAVAISLIVVGASGSIETELGTYNTNMNGTAVGYAMPGTTVTIRVDKVEGKALVWTGPSLTMNDDRTVVYFTVPDDRTETYELTCSYL